MSAKNVWIAFGLGLTAGAAVALLYAPQSGERTRRQIKKNIDDSVDYLEDAAGYLREQAEYLSKEAQKTIKRTKGHVEEVVDKATGVVSDAVKGVQSLM
jgi:gas vesicle protein